MLVIHAEFPLAPDAREEALALVEDLVAASQEEDGVIEYRAATDVSDPNLLRFHERYEDEAAFAAHGETTHVEEFQAALPDLLAGEPEVLQFAVESTSAVEF
jgi:quinol monooxygenase YgiN